MGGKALKLHGLETERKSTKDFLRICDEIQPIINGYGISTHVVKCYHNKETHGDLDLLLKIDHEVYNKGINIKELIKNEFNPQVIHNNGGVYSFDYDNFQIDLIPVKEKNWEVSKTFFDYSPVGNLMGKSAHKFGMKYGFKGLEYPFRNFNGRLSRNITISKDIEKIFNFLGYDYERYLKGFDTLEEIFEWVVNSKYFNYDNFQYENLNHIDKKRNKKRTDYNQFLTYINNYSGKNYNFKRKEDYLSDINNYFPEVKLFEQLKELKRKDEEKRLMADKFNGHLIMEKTDLKGKELGQAMNNFKKSLDNWNEYCLNTDADTIMKEFLNFIN